MRYVRVAVERDAVRRCFDDLVERSRESRHSLPWQSVDQVGIDRGESVRPRGVDHGAGFGFALDAIDRCLYRGVEILNAHGNAVEAQLGEKGNRMGADL